MHRGDVTRGKIPRALLYLRCKLQASGVTMRYYGVTLTGIQRQQDREARCRHVAVHVQPIPIICITQQKPVGRCVVYDDHAGALVYAGDSSQWVGARLRAMRCCLVHLHAFQAASINCPVTLKAALYTLETFST
ncbi:hypothetical protein FHY33_003923 [Xanthomonas arboricola]|nr:hypothetical protein [Xanthomonas campestris]